MEENKYHPFTEQEFFLIKAEMDAAGYYLPRDGGAQKRIWDNCSRIKSDMGGQPSCTCKSQVHRWVQCYDVIKEFIKSRS